MTRAKPKQELKEYAVKVLVTQYGRVTVLAGSQEEAEMNAETRANWKCGFHATEMTNWEVQSGSAESND